MGFPHVDVQTHAVNLAEGDALQPLVEHANTVLLALDSLADNIGHAAGADGQLLLAVGKLFRQTAEFDLHLLNRFHRIVGADDILADTLAQMLIHGDKELDFAFRAFRIFRNTQHIAQMFVIRDRQTQRAERLIRHGAQLICGQVSQLATMQATLHAVVFHQAHDRAPARFGADHLFAHFAVIALQLAQSAGQVIHFRFAEGQRFLKLIAARAVVAELSVELIAAQTGALFGAGVGAYANILKLFMQVVEQLFFGVIRAFQRCQHLMVLIELRGVGTQRVAGAGAFRFRLLQAMAQLLVQIAITAEHLCGIRVAKVGATLHHFGQRKRLLTRVALGLLRIRIVFFQLFKLLRVALKNGNDRLQLCQLIAVLLYEARGFLRFVKAFLDFIHAIGQRVVGQ